MPSPVTSTVTTRGMSIADIVSRSTGPRCYNGVYLERNVFRINGDIESQARGLAVGEISDDYSSSSSSARLRNAAPAVSSNTSNNNNNNSGGGNTVGSNNNNMNSNTTTAAAAAGGGGGAFTVDSTPTATSEPILTDRVSIGKVIASPQSSSALSDTLFGRPACLVSVKFSAYRVRLVNCKDVHVGGEDDQYGTALSTPTDTSSPVGAAEGELIAQHACKTCMREERYGSEGNTRHQTTGVTDDLSDISRLYGDTAATHLLPVLVQRAIALASNSRCEHDSSSLPSSPSPSPSQPQDASYSPSAVVQLLSRSSSPLYRTLATRFRDNRKQAAEQLHHFLVLEQVQVDTNATVMLGHADGMGLGGSTNVSSIIPGMEAALRSMSIDEEAAFVVGRDAAYEQLVRLRTETIARDYGERVLRNGRPTEEYCINREHLLCDPLLYVIKVTNCAPAVRLIPPFGLLNKITVIAPGGGGGFTTAGAGRVSAPHMQQRRLSIQHVAGSEHGAMPNLERGDSPKSSDGTYIVTSHCNPFHYFSGCRLLFADSKCNSSAAAPGPNFLALRSPSRAQEALAVFLTLALGTAKHLQHEKTFTCNVFPYARYTNLPILPLDAAAIGSHPQKISRSGNGGDHGASTISPAATTTQASTQQRGSGGSELLSTTSLEGSAQTASPVFKSPMDALDAIRMRLARALCPPTSTAGTLRALAPGIHRAHLAANSALSMESNPYASGSIAAAVAEHNLAVALSLAERVAQQTPAATEDKANNSSSSACGGGGGGTNNSTAQSAPTATPSPRWFPLNEDWRSLADTESSPSTGPAKLQRESAISFLDTRFFSTPREGATVSFRINIVCPLTGSFSAKKTIENVQLGTSTLPYWLDVALQSMRVGEMATLTVAEAEDDATLMSMVLGASLQCVKADLSAASVATHASLDDISAALGHVDLGGKHAMDTRTLGTSGWWPAPVASAFHAAQSAALGTLNNTTTKPPPSAVSVPLDPSAVPHLSLLYPNGASQEYLHKLETEPGVAEKFVFGTAAHAPASKHLRRSERTYRIVLDSASNPYSSANFYFENPKESIALATSLCAAADALLSSAGTSQQNMATLSKYTGGGVGGGSEGVAGKTDAKTSGATSSKRAGKDVPLKEELYFPPSTSSPRRSYVKVIQKLSFALFLLTFNVVDCNGSTASESYLQWEHRRQILIGNLLEKLSSYLTKIKGQSALVVATCSAALLFFPETYHVLVRRAECWREMGNFAESIKDLTLADSLAEQELQRIEGNGDESQLNLRGTPTQRGKKSDSDSIHDASSIRSDREFIQSTRERIEKAMAE